MSYAEEHTAMTQKSLHYIFCIYTLFYVWCFSTRIIISHSVSHHHSSKDASLLQATSSRRLAFTAKGRNTFPLPSCGLIPTQWHLLATFSLAARTKQHTWWTFLHPLYFYSYITDSSCYSMWHAMFYFTEKRGRPLSTLHLSDYTGTSLEVTFQAPLLSS